MRARIVSGLVLGVLALSLTYAGALPFAVLVAAFVILMAWEWGHLVRQHGFDGAFVVQSLTTAAAAILTAYHCPGCALLFVVIGTVSVFLLRLTTLATDEAWWSATGVYYAGLPAIALIWIRTDPDYGWPALLFLFVVVWTTDIAAFAFGRLIGGPRLAPRISPKKTWSGFLGGLILAVICGAGLAAFLIHGAALWQLAALSALLSLVAQLGDLSESRVKRIFGRKDTSTLIPGHGGVLDRIDGLLLVAMAAAIIALLRDPGAPGRALLIWGGV